MVANAKINVMERHEFRLDRENYGLWFVATVAFFGLSVWMAAGGFVEHRGPLTIYLGYLCAVMSAFAGIRQFYRLLKLPENRVVVLEPFGFTDRRISPTCIPWSRIVRVRRYNERRKKHIELELDNDTDKLLDIALLEEWHHRLTTSCRWKLALNAIGIWADIDELHHAMVAYWRAHSPYAVEGT